LIHSSACPEALRLGAIAKPLEPPGGGSAKAVNAGPATADDREGREFSWYSTRGNGFRIDHAFLSPALAARAGEIRYSHDERFTGLSDHSALILDLDV
jgi:endonuclease/exonuclease/phosphatase family metal-dependent hydrolase